MKAEFIERLEHNTTTHKLSSLNEKITQCTSPVEIDACLTDFVEIIDSTAKPFFKKFRDTDQNNMTQDIPDEKEHPWYNDECKEKKLTFMYMLDKFRANKTDENRKNLVKARSEYKKLIRKCRFNYDKEQTNKLLCAKYTNAKLYWNMLKGLSNVKPANIPLSSFEQYFKSVNNPDDPFYTADEDILHFNERYAENEFNIMFAELNLDFTQEEVLNAIKQLKLNKSGGPDMLINEFLIYGKHIFTSTLCNLFNQIFASGYFPEDWSEGYLIPLHKKGSLNDVGNYRGITLLSILGKLFTRILNNRLTDWAEKYYGKCSKISNTKK